MGSAVTINNLGGSRPQRCAAHAGLCPVGLGWVGLCLRVLGVQMWAKMRRRAQAGEGAGIHKDTRTDRRCVCAHKTAAAYALGEEVQVVTLW